MFKVLYFAEAAALTVRHISNGAMLPPVGHPSSYAAQRSSTAQQLVDWSDDEELLAGRSYSPSTKATPAQDMVLRVEATLAMEILYHVLYNVEDPSHISHFESQLSHKLRGDQLTIFQSSELKAILENLCEQSLFYQDPKQGKKQSCVAVSLENYCSKSFDQLWKLRGPVVYSDSGALMKVSSPSHLDTHRPNSTPRLKSSSAVVASYRLQDY